MPSESPAEPVSPSASFERAVSGRAKCRACDQRIGKGEWRVGDVAPNPFTEGTTTYWFHVRCAALRRPEVLVRAAAHPTAERREALDEWRGADPSAAKWLQLAQASQAHPRLSRLSRLERAPSGRARCRHCRELIGKDALRVVLHLFQDGRFEPMGFLHAGCTLPYVGAPIDEGRLEALLETLPEQEHRSDVERQLQAPDGTPSPGS